MKTQIGDVWGSIEYSTCRLIDAHYVAAGMSVFKFCVSGESAVGWLRLWLRQENGSNRYAQEESQCKQTWR